MTPRVEVGDDLGVVEAARRLHGRGDDLTHGVGLGHVRVDLGGRATVLLDELGHHGLALGVARTAVPGVGHHDAVGVTRSDGVQEGLALVGTGRGDEGLGVVVRLFEGLHEGRDGRHVDGAQDDDLRVGGGHGVSDGRVVRRFGGERLVVHRLDPGRLDDLLGDGNLRFGERVGRRRVGDGLGSLTRGQRGEPLRERDESVRHGQRGVKDVVQTGIEDGRRPARAFDHGVAVAVHGGRRRKRQERRERTEGQVHVVRRDQGLVVRDHLRRARRVRDDLQLDLVTEQSALFVLIRGPQFVALLKGVAVAREVTRK